MNGFDDLSAVDLLTCLRERQLSAVDAMAHYLARIERLDVHPKRGLGAFTHIDGERALTEAAKKDEQWSTEDARIGLWGMPVADKDLYQRAGMPTTYGSRFSTPDLALNSDPIVSLVDDSGAISLGKTASCEFGMTAYGWNAKAVADGKPYPKNPYDLARDPGGSSAGAAVAVAAGMLPFAPGSDGGGSIRIPAANSGLVGLKPTRGLVLSQHTTPEDLVVHGPLARNVEDAGLLLAGLTTPKTDLLTSPYYLAAKNGDVPKRLRIGVLRQSVWLGGEVASLDSHIDRTFRSFLEWARRDGHTVDDFELPDSSSFAADFTSAWQFSTRDIPLAGHLDRVEALTRWLWEQGQLLSADQAEATLARLRIFAASVAESVARYDLVVSPTVALLAPHSTWFDREDGPLNFAQQCEFSPFTAFVNVVGLPAVSVPMGLSTGEEPLNLPMGVQLIGSPYSEGLLLSFARHYESQRGRLTPVRGTTS